MATMSEASGELNRVKEVVGLLFGPPSSRSFRVRYWDGSEDPCEPSAGDTFALVFNSPGALRSMLLPPTEMSIAETFLSGRVDIDGHVAEAIGLGDVIAEQLQTTSQFAKLLPKIARLPSDQDNGNHTGDGHRFSAGVMRTRDMREGGKKAIQHHYDVGNDFYKLWLDDRMVYTCAYFRSPNESLNAAQEAKLDHICRKLRLIPGMKLLDIGCGWGALIIHAAKNYGVDALGITLSEAQAALGRERIREAGVESKCRIELRDYRDLALFEQFDRVASVGMMEHVGYERLPGYFEAAYKTLRPGGVFMNHTIVSVNRARERSVMENVKARLWRRDEFVHRYVFPDGMLVPAAHVVACAERAGFELRDVESLREHYAMTLRHWLSGLESRREDAITMVGERIFRIWRLYMSAAIHGFDTGGINIIQVLLSKPENGRSGFPLTRDYMYS
jgi:cyclopropane-fatty-acyl-phospholipid synthase